ncbi:GTP cyclohydrolase II [Methylobacter sp.]|uniref:GTP cyclohydrolase II n=1 Tax=Methylobacter sp. TaxID=2051955 RepID=UPI002FDD4CF0
MKNLVKISSSNLPTEFGDYVIHAYKDIRTSVEHVALIMGIVHLKENVLTRIHSECLTGDIFSSNRCDCGKQLKLAQQLIAEENTGIIIYLRDHEGRGIGLGNKIRAYALQDRGLDTVEANIALGLPVDGRSFEIASEILENINVGSIRLMSNNPDKFNAIKKLGISINGLVPLAIAPNKSNFHYLQTKRLKLGHLLKNAYEAS